MRAQIVSFHCVMKNQLGHVLSSSFNRDVINQQEGDNSRLEGLVAGLQNVTTGEKRQITVPANRAFGVYDPQLVIEVPRAELRSGDSLVVGSEIFKRPQAQGVQNVYRVIHSKADSVILDGNHLYAGQDLIFEIEVVSVREAIEEDYQESLPRGKASYLH